MAKYNIINSDVKEPAKEVAKVKLEPGQIYTVRQITGENGKRKYVYAMYDEDSIEEVESGETNYTLIDKLEKDGATKKTTLVENLSEGLYYKKKSEDKVVPVECDLNNYKTAYQYSSTPWIVSNLKGDSKHIELTKLFRFHTIDDGVCSLNEIKISIENIKPDLGYFDVVVRDIKDSDGVPVVLERFSQCSLVPGTAHYLPFKIGSFDETYESKSKYVVVEMNESAAVENSVPAGFLGYPVVHYGGETITGANNKNIKNVPIKYNTVYDPEIKARKQYFGLSDITGVDADFFTFKGNTAYIDLPEFTSNGFHLDCRLDEKSYNEDVEKPSITVDGEPGYTFVSVGINNRTSVYNGIPVIGSEEEMVETIYENVNMRKFTVYFYGGFDGWDLYRKERSNTDDFKLSNYRGNYDKASGKGFAFDRINNPESLGLNQNGLTSDWYAYLAGIRQFSNPEVTDINILATPGIDYVNQTLLVKEAIEMVEEERADSIYVVTTPDKPSGADDFSDNIYEPSEATSNLDYADIDSNYTCTYFPWVKYFDTENSQYIYLPPTKDAVRNFAATDNTAYPWYAPAGMSRGNVDCVKARFTTKLADEDELYDNRINPVKTFRTDGPKLWGQKTLQVSESQLNRVAVRRLLLRMRKLIAIGCRNLIFEPNDPTARNSFQSIITPIMDNIRANRGISDYRVQILDTVETDDCRELNARILFKPICALEYITLDFTITPQGVDFSDI